MSENKELYLKLRELLKDIFIAKCHLEEASMTNEEEESINELDSNELIENIKDIIYELISFKREFLKLDKAELIKRSEQFEIMLQKLEAEVRNHISIEHQLKLHIENNQAQTEELEGKNNKYIEQIRELNEKIKNNAKGHIDKKEIRDNIEKIEKLEHNLMKKDMIIKQLEAEIYKNKRNTEVGESRDNNAKKNEYKRGKEKSEDIEAIKQKFEEKAADLMKIEQIIREKNTPKPMKERKQSLRKSINESDSVKHKIVDSKNSIKLKSRSHSRSSSDQARPFSGLKKDNKNKILA